MAKRFNIVTARKYEKDGEEKKAWLNVGSLVYFPAKDDKEEGYVLELNMYPTTKFYVFKQEKKEKADTNGHDDDAI